MAQMRLNLQTNQATRLMMAASVGQTNLDKGRTDYQRAFKNVEVVATTETLTTLRESGRRYARAVAEHIQSVMAWLTYLDGAVGDVLRNNADVPD
jgi:hypothetical protein